MKTFKYAFTSHIHKWSKLAEFSKHHENNNFECIELSDINI